MAKHKRSFQRTDRVNQQLLELISRTLLFEISDPRVQGVQLTAVECAPDLSFARVFYILSDEAHAEQAQGGLERVMGFIRRHLSDKVHMRRVPELRFVFDSSMEKGQRIESLLANVTYADEEE